MKLSLKKDQALLRIKLLSLDVDGVLTDGGLYYDQNGTVMRKFNVRDGVGIEQLQANGIEVAIISAGTSNSILHRAKRLKIAHIFTGAQNKLVTLEKLAKKLKIDFLNIAHIGDDINDIEVMKAVGCPITVADGAKEVKDCATIITKQHGGRGAVREVCDAIMALKNNS